MKDGRSGDYARHRCQHRRQIGGRGARYAGSADTPPKSQVDRARIAGRRVREHPLEKVKREELLKQEALLAARLLQGAEIELLPTRSLFEAATRMSIEIDHPAYDCLYLALAVEKECPFVTADERFLRKLQQDRQHKLRGRAISLIEAVKL